MEQVGSRLRTCFHGQRLSREGSEQWQRGRCPEALSGTGARRRGEKVDVGCGEAHLAPWQRCIGPALKALDRLKPYVYQSRPVSPAVASAFREGPTIFPLERIWQQQPSATICVFSSRPLNSPVSAVRQASALGKWGKHSPEKLSCFSRATQLVHSVHLSCLLSHIQWSVHHANKKLTGQPHSPSWSMCATVSLICLSGLCPRRAHYSWLDKK